MIGVLWRCNMNDISKMTQQMIDSYNSRYIPPMDIMQSIQPQFNIDILLDKMSKSENMGDLNLMSFIQNTYTTIIRVIANYCENDISATYQLPDVVGQATRQFFSQRFIYTINYLIDNKSIMLLQYEKGLLNTIAYAWLTSRSQLAKQHVDVTLEVTKMIRISNPHKTSKLINILKQANIDNADTAAITILVSRYSSHDPNNSVKRLIVSLDFLPLEEEHLSQILMVLFTEDEWVIYFPYFMYTTLESIIGGEINEEYLNADSELTNALFTVINNVSDFTLFTTLFEYSKFSFSNPSRPRSTIINLVDDPTWSRLKAFAYNVNLYNEENNCVFRII